MAVPRNRTSLKALRNLISEAETILATHQVPQGRAERAHELLRAALALTDDLLKVDPAAQLGAKGGAQDGGTRGGLLPQHRSEAEDPAGWETGVNLNQRADTIPVSSVGCPTPAHR